MGLTDAATEVTADTPFVDPAMPPAAVDDGGSLAAHESEFGGGRRAQTRERPQQTPPAAVAPQPASDALPETERQPRHRAKSQQAKPEDVAEIQRLTRDLRTLEEELGEASEGRKTTLERQIAALTAKKQAKQAGSLPAAPSTATPAPSPAARVEAPAPHVPAGGYTKPMPKLDDFSASEDPYSDWQTAKTIWTWEKQQHEQQQAQSTQAQQAASARDYQTMVDGHTQRLQAYTTATPGAMERLSSVRIPLGGAPLEIFKQAIFSDDNGPKLLDTLAQQPQLLVDAADVARRNHEVTYENVAYLRWWLQTKISALGSPGAPRVPAGNTGAVATPTFKPSPPPPTPVRTGANVTGGSQPPGESAPLADHEAYYSASRRRR